MTKSNTGLIGTTVIALVLFGTYYNSQQINRLKPVILNHDLPSPSRHIKTNNGGLSTHQRASCLKARINTVPASMFGNLPRPFVNLGFPKMGMSIVTDVCSNFCPMKSHTSIEQIRYILPSCIFRMWWPNISPFCMQQRHDYQPPNQLCKMYL